MNHNEILNAINNYELENHNDEYRTPAENVEINNHEICLEGEIILKGETLTIYNQLTGEETEYNIKNIKTITMD